MPPDVAPRALDGFLPRFDVESQQRMRIDAPADLVYDVACSLVPDDVPGARTLFWIRALPSRLARGPRLTWPRGRPVLQPEADGVTLLLERPPRERVLGLIGRFWQPSGGMRRGIDSPGDFLDFAEPGYAKAAIALEIDPLGPARCRATTHTRVGTTCDDARRRFGAYWSLIRPGSAVLRWAFLAAVRDRAEAAAADGRAGTEARRAG